MPVSVRQIAELLEPAYAPKLIAGEAGLDRADISWVSIVEDYDVEQFKKTNQVILTSGIHCVGSGALLEFASNIRRVDARALFIKTGRYITEIPGEIVDFCNSSEMPLFTIEWGCMMSDIVKDISHLLIEDENRLSRLEAEIRGLILESSNGAAHTERLQALGIKTDGGFCPMLIRPADGRHATTASAARLVARLGCISNMTNVTAIPMMHADMILVVMVGASRKDIERYIAAADRMIFGSGGSEARAICVGRIGGEAEDLGTDLRRLMPYANLAQRRKGGVVFYDDMSLHKLISEIESTEFLDGFYDASLGALERYDRENSTQLAECVRAYIDSGGNVKEVAASFYVHRNTINNYLNKIRDITGIDPFSLDGKVVLCLALRIADLRSEG